MLKVLSLPISIGPIVTISIAGVFTYTGGYTVWSYTLWGLAVIWLIVSVIYSLINRKKSSKGREKPLKVSQPEIYQVGDGSHWLRLKVENPTASPIRDCYGKLLDRKMLGKLSKLASAIEKIPPEWGNLSWENWQLPPEGHRFPWSLTEHSLTSKSISGNGGFEFLYIVTKKGKTNYLYFPNSAGNEYANYRLGDFELKLEFGSESESISPTKVCVVFRAEVGGLKLISLDTLKG